MQFSEKGLNELLERVGDFHRTGGVEFEMSVEEVRNLIDPGGVPWLWGDEHREYLMAWAKKKGVILNSRWMQKKIWFSLS